MACHDSTCRRKHFVRRCRCSHYQEATFAPSFIGMASFHPTWSDRTSKIYFGPCVYSDFTVQRTNDKHTVFYSDIHL